MKNQKYNLMRMRNILFSSALSLVVASCDDKEEAIVIATAPANINLTVVASGTTFAAEGSSVNLTIASDYVWEVSYDQTWVSHKVGDNEKYGQGNAVVTLTAEGRKGDARTATITVNSAGAKKGAKSEVFTITQAGTVPADAGNVGGDTVNVYPNATARLSTAAIEGATSYEWYKDGTFLQSTDKPELDVSASGVYKVAGKDDTGEGVKSPNAVTVTITPLADMEITVSPAISGDDANDCASKDSIQKKPTVILKKNAVKLSVGYVHGATAIQWHKDGADFGASIDVSSVSADEWDSITAKFVTVVDDAGTHSYTVRATNSWTGAAPKAISDAKVVSLFQCQGVDSLNAGAAVAFIGTWQSSSDPAYTLTIDTVKVGKTSAELVIKTNFGIFDSVAVIKATIDLSHVTIEAQLVLAESSEADADSVPAYLAAYNSGISNIGNAAAKKPIRGAISNSGGLVITFEDAYILYKGDDDGTFVGDAQTGEAIVKTGAGVVWTKQP
jgi:hypothetical protein